MVLQYFAVNWLFQQPPVASRDPLVPPLNPLNPPIAYFEIKLGIITFLGISTAWLGIWVILLVQGTLENISRVTIPTQAHYDLYFRLQGHLHRSILILGAIVGLATLATGALRSWRISEIRDYYPPELVLVYGGMYTIVVALIYVPVYASLLRFGRKIRDAWLPLPLLNSEAWRDVHAKRRDFEQVLQLSLTSSHGYQAGIAILAPLIGRIISVQA